MYPPAALLSRSAQTNDSLLARFKFSRVPGRDPKPVMILTLRPEGGVWLHVDPA